MILLQITQQKSVALQFIRAFFSPTRAVVLTNMSGLTKYKMVYNITAK